MPACRPLIHALFPILALACAAPLQAAELITLEDECNGRQLLIKGPIEDGDYQRFAERLGGLVSGQLPEVQDPDVLWTVKLDSPGGDIEEAMAIGRLLRRALATTEVSYRYARRADGVYDFERGGELVCLEGDGRLSGCHQDIVEARCTGACLLIWLAGAERHANEGRLGMHGLAAEASSGIAGYLAEMQVPAEWRARILAQAPEGDGWLPWAERHQLGGRAPVLQSLVAECPAPLSREQSYLSVTAADEAERDRLMALAEQHRTCRRELTARARTEAVRWLTDAAARVTPAEAMAAAPR